MLPQDFPGKIRSFEVLGPSRIELVDLIVPDLQCIDLLYSQFVIDNGYPVDITMLVEIPHCKRTLQVCANKVTVQDLLHPRNKLTQNLIEFQIWRR